MDQSYPVSPLPWECLPEVSDMVLKNRRKGPGTYVYRGTLRFGVFLSSTRPFLSFLRVSFRLLVFDNLSFSVITSPTVLYTLWKGWGYDTKNRIKLDMGLYFNRRSKNEETLESTSALLHTFKREDDGRKVFGIPRRDSEPGDTVGISTNHVIFQPRVLVCPNLNIRRSR